MPSRAKRCAMVVVIVNLLGYVSNDYKGVKCCHQDGTKKWHRYFKMFSLDYLVHCPIRSKWSPLITYLLRDGQPQRYSQLKRQIVGISQKMLTVTLRALEADGLVKRTVYAQIPPKVEYELTTRGKSLLPHLHKLVNWAKENMSDIKESRGVFENAANY